MLVFAIDVAVLATIAFCAWRGYKNGLIRGAFGVVALIVSLLIANIAAKAYSEEFTGILKPFIGGIVDTTIVGILDEGAAFKPEQHDHENKSREFGVAYTALRRIGLPEASAAHIAELAADNDVIGSLSDPIADRLSSVLAFVAVFGIAFILLAIVFAVIGNLVGFVFSLPGLKLVDSITGVALGLVKGFLIVYALAVVVRYFGLLVSSTLEETSVLRYFVNNNPIANMLGL